MKGRDDPVGGDGPAGGVEAAAGSVTAWAVTVVVAVAWGTAFVDGVDAKLRAAPLAGHWRGNGGPGLLVAVALGAAVVAAGPGLARRLRWRAVPWATGFTAAAWTTVLAASSGWDHLTEPLTTRHEYEPFAAGVTDVGGFLSTYTDELGTFPIHVQGHPPGPVVIAWMLDRIGLDGAGWLAALALAGWGLAVAAALVAARAVAGEAAARRAAPALAVLPAAVWAGTSLDALFAGLTAAATACAVLAVTRRSLALAVAAGALAGVALLCSYGAVAAFLIPVLATAVLAAGRLPNPDGAAGQGAVVGGGAAPVGVLAAGSVAGGLAVLGVAAAAGFWWPAGLAATREAYWAGIGGQRPAAYLTLVGNPAALALATGPAVAAGLGMTLARAWRASSRRDRVSQPAPAPAGLVTLDRAWRAALLPAAALVAVLLADLSQMSRGETERIWLLFVPWLAVAAPGDRRGWLAAQVAVALTLQSVLDSPW